MPTRRSLRISKSSSAPDSQKPHTCQVPLEDIGAVLLAGPVDDHGVDRQGHGASVDAVPFQGQIGALSDAGEGPGEVGGVARRCQQQQEGDEEERGRSEMVATGCGCQLLGTALGLSIPCHFLSSASLRSSTSYIHAVHHARWASRENIQVIKVYKQKTEAAAFVARTSRKVAKWAGEQMHMATSHYDPEREAFGY